ncbi:unnamed protein product [Adineta steineri]|uniref:Uncharacterized protein n=1 Tax=Adineta steineri TaxID=433720 RepID=A0A818RZU6_9BILA|nr:unnamed protein product [Adineta steineri]CAF3662229.1 unnamed protein product [Adineta steineri]
MLDYNITSSIATKWIEKLKYDVLRFSLDSIDLNLIEVGNAVNIQLKRPSYVGLATNSNISSCACLGGLTNYYTLVQGEQFFKSSFRLSKQSLFDRSLFLPDLHVLHSHFIFEHKYN